MQLESVTVHDFGLYRGRQVLDLSATSEERRIVLIGGLNGRGKTTMLEAIQLALYGGLASCVRESERSYESYLRNRIHRDANAQDGAGVAVRFSSMRDGRKQHYAVDRRWRVAGDRAREKLTVVVDGEPAEGLAGRWAEHMEALLPRRLAELCFFDGEEVEALADPARSATALRAAVHSLFGLDLIERLSSDLQGLEKRQKVDTLPANAQRELATDEETIAGIADHASDLRQQVARLRGKIERLDGKIEEARFAYEREGGRLFDERESASETLAATRRRATELNESVTRLALGPLPLVLVSGALEALAGESPDALDPTTAAIVDDVLAERDARLIELLDERMGKGKALDAVTSFLEGDRARRLKESVGEAASNVRGRRQASALLNEELPAAVSVAAERLAALESVNSECDRFESQLSATPEQDSLFGAQADLRELGENQRKAQVALELAERDLEENQRRQEMAGRDYARRLEVWFDASVDNAGKLRLLEQSERARRSLATFRKRLLEARLASLEELVFDSVRQLLGKTRLVGGLRINPQSFTVELSTPSGQAVSPQELSVGERQLLAISILWGVVRATGRRLPLVVDTPMGRLDSEHRRRLVESYFPVAGHQVVLLSTDEEVDEEHFGALNEMLAMTYTLEYDEDSSSTTIRPGYFWEAA